MLCKLGIVRQFFTKTKFEKVSQPFRKYIKTKTTNNKWKYRRLINKEKRAMPFLKKLDIASLSEPKLKFMISTYSDLRNINRTTRKFPNKKEFDEFIAKNKEYQMRKHFQLYCKHLEEAKYIEQCQPSENNITVLPMCIAKDLYETTNNSMDIWTWSSDDYNFKQQFMHIYPPEYEAFNLMAIPVYNDMVKSTSNKTKKEEADPDEKFDDEIGMELDKVNKL